MKISKELKIGVVALLTIAAFYWLFKFLQGENLFTKGDIFYVKYGNVDGLLPTKPVNVNGLRVGRVEDILIKEGKDSLYFVVKMVLERDLDFTKNTVAEIYEPGIMAGKMVQLNLSYEGEKAKNGDTLMASSNPSLMKMISEKLAPTQNRIDSVLVNLNSALDRFSTLADEQTNQSLKEVLNKLDRSIYAIGLTANSLSKTSDNANNLIENTNAQFGNLSGETQKLMQTTTTTMSKYGDVADKINATDIQATLDQLNAATQSLNKTLTRFEQADGTINKAINNPELYDNLNETAKNLNVLLQDFNQRPDRYVQFSVFGKKYKEPKKKKSNKEKLEVKP